MLRIDNGVYAISLTCFRLLSSDTMRRLKSEIYLYVAYVTVHLRLPSPPPLPRCTYTYCLWLYAFLHSVIASVSPKALFVRLLPAFLLIRARSWKSPRNRERETEGGGKRHRSEKGRARKRKREYRGETKTQPR